MTAEAHGAERPGLNVPGTTAGAELDKAAHPPFSIRGFIARERWDSCLDIRMHISVFVPMPQVSLQSLLELSAGQVLEARWPVSQDVPLLVEDMFLASGELEPVGEKLGVRINGFTEQQRPSSANPAKEATPSKSKKRLDSQRECSLEDLQVTPQLCFGQADVPMREVLGLCVGDIVILDRPVVAPVTLVAGGRLVASGDLVMVQGDYAIRIDNVSTLVPHLPPYYAPF